MKKRTLTPEQTAARDARRSKFRDLARKIKAMSDAERAALTARMPAIVTIEGRALSPINSILIGFQLPQASIVGGFRQWIKNGRAVMKGQHGAAIWVPTGAKGDDREDGTAGPGAGDVREESAGDDGGSCRFIMGTVFDVTQTNEIGAEPVAVVSAEVAEAFGMRNLPNVRIDEHSPEYPERAGPRVAGEGVEFNTAPELALG